VLSLLWENAAKGFDLPLLNSFQCHLQKLSVNAGVRMQMLNAMEKDVTESDHATQSTLYQPSCFGCWSWCSALCFGERLSAATASETRAASEQRL